MPEKRTTLEKIASSVEEAITEGLNELGRSQEDVEIEILDEGNKGLFGLGARQARVRLTLRAAEQPTPTKETIEEAAPEKEMAANNEPAQDNGDAESDPTLTTAQQIVSELLEKMGVKAKVTAEYVFADDSYGRPPIRINITGDDLSILIGRKAETLDALQYITKLILGKELEYAVPIIVDVEGFRARREDQIRQIANTMARQVAKTGRSQSLEPMPAHERRIAHIELRDHPDVFTESTGEHNRRKVVIHPRD